MSYAISCHFAVARKPAWTGGFFFLTTLMQPFLGKNRRIHSSPCFQATDMEPRWTGWDVWSWVKCVCVPLIWWFCWANGTLLQWNLLQRSRSGNIEAQPQRLMCECTRAPHTYSCEGNSRCSWGCSIPPTACRLHRHHLSARRCISCNTTASLTDAQGRPVISGCHSNQMVRVEVLAQDDRSRKKACRLCNIYRINGCKLFFFSFFFARLSWVHQLLLWLAFTSSPTSTVIHLAQITRRSTPTLNCSDL